MGFTSYITAILILIPTGVHANVESRIQHACQSQWPALIYDNFGSKTDANVDVNGDLEPDVNHGDFVEALAKRSGPTLRKELGGPADLSEVYKQLDDVVKQIKSGALKISRINFSQENSIRIGAFKDDLFATDNSVPQLTAQNIHLYNEQILARIAQSWPEFKVAELTQVFKELEALGVPFVTIAGNNGVEKINLYSLFPGVITVGALDVDGTKRPSSADHTLVQVWRRGVFVSQKIEDGIDINQDGIVDFSNSTLSTQPAVVSPFVGKPALDLLTPIQKDFKEWMAKGADTMIENAALNTIPVGFYNVDELVSIATVSAEKAKQFRKSGAFVYKAKNTAPASIPFFFFDVDSAGNVIFDPLKNGEPDQLAVNSGTSFAAPVICE